MEDPRERIAEALQRLLEEGDDGSFAVFLADESRNYYVQAAGDRDRGRLVLEAVSNEYLDSRDALTEDQLSRLVELGWSAGEDPTSNYVRQWPANPVAAGPIADFLLRTLTEVYGWSPGSNLKIDLQLE